MIARLRPAWIGVPVLWLAACAHQTVDTHTLASLKQVSPDTMEVPVEQGIDRAMQSYRQFLDQAPDSKLAPEAMRRLADLKIEKEYGIQGDGKLVDLPPASVSLTTQPPATVNAAKAGPASAGAKGKGAKSPPPPAIAKIDARASQSHGPATGTASGAVSTERDLEQRAAFEQLLVSSGIPASVALPDGLDAALQRASGPQVDALRDRVLRLKGVITWNLYTEYPERLTAAYKHLHELDEDVKTLNERYTAFVRTRQAAVHSYVGYEEPIRALRTRVDTALDQVNALMARQGHLIETVAIEELQARGQRLQAYQTQARYAVADSYDRATKAQAGGGQP